MENKLKSCPFCGEEAKFTAGNCIGCTSCPAQMIWDDEISEDEMIALWNSRS